MNNDDLKTPNINFSLKISQATQSSSLGCRK